jgi:Ca2+-binding RTX toxin-like protein
LGNNVENLTGYNAAGMTLTGNSLNNVIRGAAGNDTIIGALGNDYLYGGSGVDTYIFQGDFGNDTVGVAANNNVDIIDFSSFTSSAASVSIGGSGGDDLIVTIGVNTLTIADWNLGGGYKLNTFAFSDGTKSTNGSSWL